ncbi:MAG: hypothetical protein FJY44_05550, partial [Betaproteobacteria bacterium]|nr:hypothetical protein [Betaproteobacteria bacterium]
WQATDAPAFDRILIETSGLADPAPIIQSVVAEPRLARWLRMQTVITVVDCVNASHQLEQHPESLKQVVLADLLLLSKTDLAGTESAAGLRDRLAALNAGALIADAGDTATVTASINNAPALGDARSAARWLGFRPAMASPPKATLPRPVAKHLDSVNSVSLWLERPVYWNGLTLWLQMLPAMKGDRLLRVKGLLDVEGQPVAVHIVHSVVHEPRVMERWPDAEQRSRLVFIGHDLRAEELEAGLELLSYAGPPAAAGFTVEASAYAEFLQVATRLR